MAKIYGVNLGNWLVLEYWMDHSLFDGVETNTPDETKFSELLGDKKFERLKYHRDHFITKADFEWLKQVGINSVRIPVPHWIFGDCDPYVGSIEYLDKAFDWAEQVGISVLIDLHCAPGCQNGFDNGGITGVTDWWESHDNIPKTVDVIGRLAARYKNEKALYGIQLLNEPIDGKPTEFLREYYLKGYDECRKYLDEDKAIVIHDQFCIDRWKDFMQTPEYKNVVLDTHCYQCFSEDDLNRTPAEHIRLVVEDRLKAIREMSAYFPIIVGEWSLGLGNGVHMRGFTDHQKQLVYRAYADAQLMVQEECLGWYFWSYKLNNNSVKTWNYRVCVENGWIPVIK